jgi:hypothetical protein
LVEAGNDEHVADFLLEGGPLSICNAFAAKRGYEGLAVVFEIGCLGDVLLEIVGVIIWFRKMASCVVEGEEETET